ncbi:MAG: efflux transporter periplasmic adaptor subunit, partial [Gammaproteobacteria bacterium]
PAMRVGQFFEAKIEGHMLNNVFVLPRRAVTQDNQIAVVDEGQLLKLPVQPVWTDRDNVIIEALGSIEMDTLEQRSFVAADQLILTPTANLASGTRVRLIGAEPERPRRRTAEKKKTGSTASNSSSQ